MAITNGRSTYDAVKVYVCSNYREKRTCTNSLRRPVPALNQVVLGWIEQNILTESGDRERA
jgi:hypothetical protein